MIRVARMPRGIFLAGSLISSATAAILVTPEYDTNTKAVDTAKFLIPFALSNPSSAKACEPMTLSNSTCPVAKE